MNTNKYQYNSWPLGKLPKEFQRPELELIKQKGYDWKDARDAVDIFEKKVADFAGSKYAITTDCCTNGLFLSLKYLQIIKEIDSNTTITIPDRTYVSVPMQILHTNCNLKFRDYEWSGLYQLEGTRIWDSAVRWTKGMYVGNDALQVISFQLKKRIPIGKGGIILTNDEKAAKWLKLASYDGRDLTVPYTDNQHVLMNGYHMYMTPEDAARGILLMDQIPDVNEDSGGSYNYTKLSELNIFGA
jgi:dTDP-4-amino-4,6-dideoxygalactose transaminase